MGTEVLRPQDYFVERIGQSPCRRRNYNYNYNNNYYYYQNQNFNNRSNRKQTRREATISKRSVSVDDVARISKNHHHHNRSASASVAASHHLVMEKVTILRRGESLDSKIKSVEAKKKDTGCDLVVTGTERLGPDLPEMVPKQLLRIVDLKSPVAGTPDVYAGSAFAFSPSPSSLPLPSFSKKKHISVDDSATRDLRRLLRLEF